MEIRANYVVVGLCSILVVLACLVFIFWISGRDSHTKTALYDIHFPRAGAGLGVGTDVLFLGIKVGSIHSIFIDPVSLSSVRVRIEIDEKTPIRTDTVATIELRNVTGSSIISLNSPSTTAPLIKPEGNEVPAIQAGVSRLEQITNNVPALLDSANSLLLTLQSLIGGKNAEYVRSILSSADRITAQAAESMPSLDLAMQGLQKTLEELAATTTTLESLASSLDTYVKSDLSVATRNFAAMTAGMGKIAEEMEPGLNRFAGEGLDELRRLLAEARHLVMTFERLGRLLENDPRRFLFGNPVPEYTP